MMRVRLFISNFNRRRAKAVGEILLVLAVIVLAGRALDYLLIDNYNSKARIRMHDFYEEDIDVLFLGSSHCEMSFNPAILDIGLGQNTFNAGSGSQRLDGSYALLVEAGKNNALKHVYVDLYYDVSKDVYKERTQMTEVYYVSDYMKPSFNKVRYLVNASAEEHYVNSFIPPRRNWRKLFEEGYIGKCMAKKTGEAYRNYRYVDNENDIYQGKGYWLIASQVEENAFYHKGHFKVIDENTQSQDSIDSILQIIEYCERNDIGLTFLSTPISSFRTVDVGNYDFYFEKVKELLAPYGIPYYDFNLVREEYMDCSDETLFTDNHHLNRYGAAQFSRLLVDLSNGEVSEEEMFYPAYREKQSHLGGGILGLIGVNVTDEEEKKQYTDEAADSKVIRIDAVMPTEETVYYNFYKMIPDTDGKIVLKEGSRDNVVVLPKGESGNLWVEATIDGKEYHHATVAY